LQFKGREKVVNTERELKCEKYVEGRVCQKKAIEAVEAGWGEGEGGAKDGVTGVGLCRICLREQATRQGPGESRIASGKRLFITSINCRQYDTNNISGFLSCKSPIFLAYPGFTFT